MTLQDAFAKINKAFGEGAIQRLGDAPQDVEVFSTGSLALDIALGIGGVPRGRIVEIFGPESSGKTTVALHIAANAQKAGGTVAFIDVEHAIDPKYAAALGVNTDELLISQPDTGEQALEIVDVLVRSSEVTAIVIDSVAALVPRAELEGDMGDAHVGLQARLMGQALRKLTGAAEKYGTALIFINQLRYKVGVIFGSPETTPGGNALKFYSSVRLDIRKIATLKTGDEVTGSRTKVKVVKNKMAPPAKIAEFDILYGTGVYHAGELIDLGVHHGVVKKSGSWFSLLQGDDEPLKLGQGRDNAAAALTPELSEEIETRIREILAVPF